MSGPVVHITAVQNTLGWMIIEIVKENVGEGQNCEIIFIPRLVSRLVMTYFCVIVELRLKPLGWLCEQSDSVFGLVQKV